MEPMANSPGDLTHLDPQGAARMVDIAGKPVTRRVAVAEALVYVGAAAEILAEGPGPKGDPFQVARVAGIAATKRTADLIPLAHPIGLTRAAVDLWRDADGEQVLIRARAETTDRTGVEMEAMTAASVAALTLYDMIKAVARDARIESVRLVYKAGGKSGTWGADPDPEPDPARVRGG